MTTRYFTKALHWTAPADLEWEAAQRAGGNAPVPTVFEPDTLQRDTGLLDISGNAIFAREDRPIGFLK